MPSITVVSWNVENLAPLIAEGEPRLAEAVRAWGDVDVVCLQEVRVRPTDTPLVARMEGALDGFVCQHALNRDPHNGRFRGGRAYGVATYVRRSLAPQPLPPLAWEHEGRVVRTAIDGLVIANVYAVNGTDRPHLDPVTGTPDGTRHAWKRRFVTALAAALTPDASRLIALGDWNVTPAAIDTHPRLRTEEPHASARRAFHEELVAGLELVDVYRALHPEQRAYTWFDRRAVARGKLDAARVDYALVARPLLPRVLRAEILEDMAFRFGSDHAPIRVELTV